MGVENNNAIIASTWSAQEVERVKTWVDNIEDDFHRSLFLFGPRVINSIRTIVMVPDGSKEGWEESDKCDELRENFILVLEQGNYEGGSSPWDYVEVGFGDYGQKLLRGNCKNRYNDDDYAV